MLADRFKELFEDKAQCDFWRYVSYFQDEKDMFYYDRGYNYYMKNGDYPRKIISSNNPYAKGIEAHDDYEAGFNQAFAEDEIAFSKRRL